MTTTIEPMLPENPDASLKKSTNRAGQFLATISVSMAALSAGTTLSWSSPCLSELENQNSSTSYHITNDESSWAGSLLTIGAFVSAIPAGIMADKFGRKNSILSLFIPFILSWLLIIQSNGVTMLFIGRFFSGIATGGICVLAPMYIAEITEDDLRGPLCSFFALFLVTGILVTFIVAIFAKFVMLSIILAMFPIVFLVSFVFMPESPTYLLKNDRVKQAKTSLKFLRGKYAEINAVLAEMKKDIENTNNEKAGIIKILTKREYLKSLIACCLLFLFAQLSGINAVIFYTVNIFEASESNIDSIVSSIIVASIQVIATIIVIFIVDKQGRKTFILQSSIMNCLTLALLGFAFHLKYFNISFAGLNWLPLASLMVYIFSFSIGLGPIPWLVLGELLSPEIIGTVSGISVVTNWFVGFVVTKSFKPMMDILKPHITFYIFSIFNALCTMAVYFLVPETKNRSYQEIYAIWSK